MSNGAHGAFRWLSVRPGWLVPARLRPTARRPAGARPTGLLAQIAEAQRLTEAAAQAQLEAAERTRAAVRELLEAGMPQADVATVLGVSRQRVTQLAGARRRDEKLAS